MKDGGIKQKKEQMQNINFLRFIFCIIIVIYHTFNAKGCQFATWAKSNDIFELFSTSAGVYGQICVDFFFVISGFFLMKTMKNVTVIDFIKNKFIRLFPLIALAGIVCLLMTIFNLRKMNIYKSIIDLLMINNIGLTLTHAGGISGTWFVSVLLWGQIFYFYIYKHCQKIISDFATILITLFSYSFLLHWFNGRICGHIASIGYVFNAGMLRGLAGIGLGIILYNLYKSDCLKLVKNKITYTIFSLFEISLAYFIIYHLTIHRISYNNDIIFILAFSTLFSLFLLKYGYLSNLLNKNFSTKLGNISYSIFLLHFYVLEVGKAILKNHVNFVYLHPLAVISILIGSSVIVGAMGHYFVEKPIIRTLKIKEKSLLPPRERSF